MKDRSTAGTGLRRPEPSPVPIPAPAAPSSGAPGSAEPAEQPPTDLISWAQFAVETGRTPHPMDRRDLQRRYRAAGGTVWSVPGRRGELVSRSAALEFHRDLVKARLASVA